MKAILNSFIVGAALAGLLGCASVSGQTLHRPPAGQPTLCNAGVCEITVTVNDCGAIGGIVVSPAYLSTSLTSGPAVIHWKIVTSGHTFSTGGIKFDPPSANFVPLPGGPSNEIRMRNIKKATGDFYYSVDVVNCIPVDPFIQNF